MSFLLVLSHFRPLLLIFVILLIIFTIPLGHQNPGPANYYYSCNANFSKVTMPESFHVLTKLTRCNINTSGNCWLVAIGQLFHCLRGFPVHFYRNPWKRFTPDHYKTKEGEGRERSDKQSKWNKPPLLCFSARCIIGEKVENCFFRNWDGHNIIQSVIGDKSSECKQLQPLQQD